MARRYDSGTTTFSPEGRLFQVEYAIEAINNGAAAIGLLAADGVVFAVQKATVSKLLAPPKSSEKVFKVDDHIMAAVAGLTSDANILLAHARVNAQQYTYRYHAPQPVEQLVRRVCDIKQGYTQFGGQRPFGVALLYAGWDKYHGFQLYQSDPSGNYGGWKATAIGSNFQSAQSSLKTLYSEDMKLEEAKKLAVKVLVKTMDSAAPTSEKLELAVLTRLADGSVEQRTLSNAETDAIIAKVMAEEAPAGDV